MKQSENNLMLSVYENEKNNFMKLQYNQESFMDEAFGRVTGMLDLLYKMDIISPEDVRSEREKLVDRRKSLRNSFKIIFDEKIIHFLPKNAQN